MDESRIADPSSALRRSDRSLPTRLSRAVSVVLHPLVMPLYVILLLVAGPTQLSYFPASVKFYLLWVTVLYTAVIPLLSVGLLRSVGRISSLAIDDRRERILPLAIGIVCYLLCAATVARIPSAMIVRKFMLAGACCELFCLAVTFYWKISLHLAAQGAAAALLVLLTFGNAGNLTGALAVAVLAAGALASARLWLGCHTIRQVAAGYVGGSRRSPCCCCRCAAKGFSSARSAARSFAAFGAIPKQRRWPLISARRVLNFGWRQFDKKQRGKLPRCFLFRNRDRVLNVLRYGSNGRSVSERRGRRPSSGCRR